MLGVTCLNTAVCSFHVLAGVQSSVFPMSLVPPFDIGPLTYTPANIISDALQKQGARMLNEPKVNNQRILARPTRIIMHHHICRAQYAKGFKKGHLRIGRNNACRASAVNVL
jgi:hypothetical protein